MSAATTLRSPPPSSVLARLGWGLKDVLVLARRSFQRIAREPEQLSDVTIQPVMFVLLFTYVFGSAIHLPGGGNYHSYLVSGMFGLTVAGTAPGTAVGLATDMASGLIDRFRSLPMSRAAVLAGRTLADLATNVLGLLVVVVTGLCIGWRVETGFGDVVVAFLLSLVFAYSMAWMGACIGMVLRSGEAAQAIGFIIFLPLSFLSNAFVPTGGMPAWMRDFANWNPLSALAASCRHLFGNPNPAASVHAWPMQHPELDVLLWSIGLSLVFAPIAITLYRRKAS